MLDCPSAMAAICARTVRPFSRPPQDFVRAETPEIAMGHIFTIIAPGAMGSAVARRMHERGATVRTSLAGPTSASPRPAAETGKVPVESDPDPLEGIDIVPAIVPPGEAAWLR